MYLIFRPIAVLSAITLLFASESRAGAITVFSQPALFPGNSGFSAWTSTFDPISRGNIYNTYDNFKLTGNTKLTSVSWQGFDFNANSLGTSTLPLNGFYISVLSDNSGIPGTVLYQQQIGGNANQSAAGNVDFFSNGQFETIYNYSAPLNGTFIGTANTAYWLSIVGNVNAPSYWTWTQGSGGNNLCYQRDFYGSLTSSRSGDRAFTLQGIVVPEPGSVALFAGMTAVSVSVLRKRRNR